MNINLDQLKELFWKNKDSMPIHSQEIFSAVLDELDKGSNMDLQKLSFLIEQLGISK